MLTILILKNQKWDGVYISDMRDHKHPVTIISKTGRISSDMETGILSIALDNGTLHRSNDDTSPDNRPLTVMK